MKRLEGALLVVGVIVVMSLGTALAQEPPSHPFEVQGFVGSYGPGPDELDDDVVFGGSFGWRMTEGFGFEAGFSTASLDGDFEDDGIDFNFDGDVIFFDTGIEWVWFPKSVVSPTLVGGMGWAFMNLDATAGSARVSIDADDLTDDSWTLYGGVGAKVQFGPESQFFLNGRWFYRWFEQRGSDSSDRELTVAFGWKF